MACSTYTITVPPLTNFKAVNIYTNNNNYPFVEGKSSSDVFTQITPPKQFFLQILIGVGIHRNKQGYFMLQPTTKNAMHGYLLQVKIYET